MGADQSIHPLAPAVPYQVQITLDTVDDVDAAFELHLCRGPDHLDKFMSGLNRAVDRIACLPHLARVHHRHLRVTALASCPYRLWYVLDEQTRTALLIGLIAVTHPSPPSGRIPGPWRHKWWLHLPNLQAQLPDPYPRYGWAANPNWNEEDDDGK